MTTVNSSRSGAVRAVLVGGTVAGVLDAVFAVIAYVFVLRAFSVVGVLQYIASGLLGRAAFSGGLATAALGVAIHFALAFFFAAVYALAAARLRVLRTAPVSSGLVYGASIWLLMDLIVLPLSGTPKFPFEPLLFTSFLIDHALFVGLPISLAVGRALRAPAPAA